MNRNQSATTARVHFGELLGGLEDDPRPVLVEKGGVTVAVVLSPKCFEALQGSSIPDDWADRADQASEIVARWLNGRPMPDIDDMINHGHDVD